MRTIVMWLVFLIALPATLLAQPTFQMGGGPLPNPQGDCISPEERMRVEANIARYHLIHGTSDRTIQATPAPYPFFPQGGNLFEDLFVNNYVDLDNTSGILDWDGTDWTYDGHRGHDVDLRTFGEQDIGVPIFAALDGTVVDAHDGEFDKNTSFNSSSANYVILWHGGSHYSYYWHMRKNSVAVSVGQDVKAGTQLGLTASSGNSTGPHLHFESWFANSWYEPSAGFARPGESDWVNQTLIRRETYFRDFNLTAADLSQIPNLPYDMPRTGTFLLGTQPIGWWINLMNYNPGSNWRVRFLRPNGTVRFDSGTNNFGQNSYYRWSWWWWRYNINFDVTGNWQVEFRINGQYIARAPFTVVANANQIVNRPPKSVNAEMDPPAPTTEEVLFCRIHPDLFDDPDYQIVRYRYLWKLNGKVVRDVTTAGDADALRAGLAHSGDLVTCTVTPTDGIASASSTTTGTYYLGDSRVTLTGKVRLEDCANLAQTVTIEFRPVKSVPALSRVVSLSDNGSFLVEGIPNENYVLAIKGSRWLRTLVPIDATGGSVSGVSVFLRAGDAFEDNAVDVFDLDIVLQAFDSSPDAPNWIPNADLNCDDSVDVFDLDLLIRNFDSVGDM